MYHTDPTDNGDDLTVAFFGTGAFGVPALEALILNNVKVRLIVTAPDRPAGRGLKVHASPIKDIAVRADIPLMQPADVNDPYIVTNIADYGCKLALIIAYGQKIGGPLIKRFERGMINLHGSLLPRYRGAAPINWALIRGEKHAGVTIIQINERIDAGAMLGKAQTKVDPTERADQLHDRLAELGGGLVMEVIDQFRRNEVTPLQQDDVEATKAPKLTKAMSRIDFSLPAETLANLIRGIWPWPGAKAIYRSHNGKTVQVSFARAETLPHLTHPGTPGEIVDDFTIICGNGRLRPLEVKPAGSRLMTWQEFINGRHVQAGDTFEPLPIKS